MYNTINIKNIRLNADKTQKDIADLMNISRSTYALWESNNNIFPIDRLVDFCNIFNISLDYVLNLSFKKTYIKANINIDKSSKRLKNLRKEFNLTQEKLALYLKTNKSVICNYEKKRSIIATPFLYDICKKYNISADYLMGRIDNPKYLE